MVASIGNSEANYLFSRSINSRLYAHALALAYRNGYEVYDPDYSLAQDPEFWEKVQRDPIIKHAMDARLHSAAGRDWQMDPGRRNPRPIDEDAAHVVEEIIEQMDDLTQGLFNLAKGIFQGESWAYIQGERKEMLIGGKKQKWWLPRRLVDIDKRRIRLRPIWESGAPKGKKIQAVYELFDLEDLTWRQILPNAPIIRFLYDNEEGRLSHGRGIAEAIYFYHYAKGVVFTEGLEGLEKWARGMITVGMENSQAGALSNETTRDNYLTQLERQRRGGIMVIDAKDDINVHWGAKEGYQQVFEWMQYLDRGIVTVILGQIIPQGGGAIIAEALTRAITESSSSETLLGYDRTVLYQALSQQLLGHVWFWNQQQLANIGLADAARPIMRATAIDDSKPVESADVITTLLAAGIPLRRQEVYKRTGFSMPGKDDDVIEPILDPGATVATDKDGKPVNNNAMTGDTIGNAPGGQKSPVPSKSRK